MSRMTRLWSVLLLTMLLPSLALAAPAPVGGGGGAFNVQRVLVAGLPAGGSDALYIVTDGANGQDCTTGGGGDRVLCEWTGTQWQAIGDGSTAGAGGAPEGATYVTMTLDDILTGESRLGTSVIMYGALASRPSSSATAVGRLYCASDSGDQRCTRDNGSSWDDLSLDWSYVLNVVVTTAQINDSAITAAKIADGAVTEAKLGAGAVTETKLGTFAVTAQKILDGAVGLDHLAAEVKACGGDLEGTWPNCTAKADSVALGTNTTGDYFGDITVNQGLVKTGNEGATVGLIPCAPGEVLKRNLGNTAWECATDLNTGGGGSGDPAGDNTQVQFNDNEVMGADDGLTYNKTTNHLTVTGGITGNASSASALAANGGNCSPGNSPLGVDTLGAAEGCFDITTQTEYNATATNLAPGGTLDISATYATRAYVDALAQGLDPKDAVVVATTANITLSGEQTIDGVLTSADRVLVKNQTNQTENGLYLSAAGAWSRTTDADTAAEIESMYVFIQQGTTQANQGWVLTTDPPLTLGATNLVYGQFSGAPSLQAGAGLTKTGDTVDIVATAGGALTVNANDIGVTPGGILNSHVGAGAAITKDKIADAGTWEVGELPAHGATSHAKNGSDPLSTADPVGFGDANAEGTANTYARSDHVHKRDVKVKNTGSVVGSRNAVNFVPGANITIGTTDDASSDEIDVTISAATEPVVLPQHFMSQSSCPVDYPDAVYGDDCIELDSGLEFKCRFPEKALDATLCDDEGDWFVQTGQGIPGLSQVAAVDRRIDQLSDQNPLILAGTGGVTGTRFEVKEGGGAMGMPCYLGDGTQCNHGFLVEEGRRLTIFGDVGGTVLPHFEVEATGLMRMPFFTADPVNADCDEVGELNRRHTKLTLASGLVESVCVETDFGVYGWQALGGSGVTDLQTAFQAGTGVISPITAIKKLTLRGEVSDSYREIYFGADPSDETFAPDGSKTSRAWDIADNRFWYFLFDNTLAWTFDEAIREVRINSGHFAPPSGTASPTGTDCDNAAEAGRIYIETDQTDAQMLHVCKGTSGWKQQGGSSSTDLSVSISRTAAQTITHDTATVIAFTTEAAPHFDTGSFHDNATNNSRITFSAATAGKYAVNCSVAWSNASATGIRDAVLLLNGTTFLDQETKAGSVAFEVTTRVSRVYNFADGDWVELQVYHDRGSNLDIVFSAEKQPVCTAYKVN